AVGETTAEAGAEAAEEQPAASAVTGIPEVDKMAAVREFAALYGPTTLIKAKDWNGTELEWVALAAEDGKAKGKQIAMPVSMVTGAKYLEVLDGYFPIYVRGVRPLGEIVSKETITVARKPKRSVEEIRVLAAGDRTAAAGAAAAAAAAAEEAGGAVGAAGAAGGGMRGERGPRGRGGRGGRG
ncbi:MAG: hypothetical protein MUQ65_02190, partial [Armatimonadetes bacterium]|nr:hypothetical protein [Armatimonadota bacterium]